MANTRPNKNVPTEQENPLFHDTWKLLKNYRDAVWNLELAVQQVRSTFEIEYGSSIEEFLEGKDTSQFTLKLYMALRKDGRLAVLVGDIRMQGRFYSIQNDMMRMGDFESFLVKGQFNCVSDRRRYQKPFIPIVTEYLLLLHKKDALLVPFHFAKDSTFSVADTDLTALTWHHLIRMTLESAGGRMALVELYDRLQGHPKAKKNGHFRERIRTTIYEHKDQYTACGDGVYRLNYQVA